MNSINVFKGNNNNKNLEAKYNDEKLKENKDKKDDYDFNDFKYGMSFKSTRIFPKDNPDNKNNKKSFKLTKKSGIMKLKKQTLKNINNNLMYIGDIEQAKTHANANRPLKKVGEFNSKTQFCKCCGLPCEKEGVMEKYSFKDSTEEFIKHGQVITLYFSFYIYSILILSYTFLAVSLPTLILNYQRSSELNEICNKISNKINIEECFIYIDTNDLQSSYNSLIDFSGLNIKNYKIIHSSLSSNKNEDLDKMMVNYSVLNFICILTILLLNFGYIILLNNKTSLPDIDLITPRKFSIIITEMDGFYSYLKEKFLSDNGTNNGEGEIINIKKSLSPSTETKKTSERGNLTDREENNNDNNENNENNDNKVSGVEKFKNLFKNRLSEIFFDKKQNFNISKVNVCFKINQYIKKEEKLEKCNEYIEKIESLPYQIQKNEEMNLKGDEREYFYSPFSNFNIHWFEKSKKLSDIIKDKKELEKQINDLLLESKKINMDKFAGTVIISFKTIKEKEDFLSNVPNNFFVYFLNVVGKLRYFFCFCCIKKIDNSKFWQRQKIQIEEAPEPEDIMFENLEFTTMKKTYRVVGMNTISLLLIGIGFGIIFGLQNLQNYVNKKKYTRIVYYLISLSITIVSSIINIIFGNMLDFLTKTEKLKSITTYYLSYSVKLALFSFLISGIIPLICEVISKTDNYEILISNMIMMFLANSIVTPLVWTFSPAYYVKKLQIYLIEKNENPNLYHNRNQKELNKLYELSDMNISYKYSYIAKTLLMTFLYVSIFPFGVLISLGGFFFCFFLEKYNYINYYKRPEMLNNTLFFFYVNNFVFFLFFLGVGDCIFLSKIYDVNGWSYANIIFLAILIIVPFQFFLNYDFIGFKESEINQLSFDDLFLDFYTDYERANPMTKKEGIKNYITQLYENNIINEKQKDSYLKNIEKINLMKAYYENRQNRNLIKIQKMLTSVDDFNKFKYKSFKSNVHKNFKLSYNYNANNNNRYKQTFTQRGERNKGLFFKYRDEDTKDENEKKNVLKVNKKKKLEQDNYIIKEEKDEKEKLEIINTLKTIKLDKKEVESKNEVKEKVKEKDKEEEKENEATKYYRSYYNDPIMLRMANSIRITDLFKTDEDEKENSDYDSFGKIEEIEEIENADEKYEFENIEEDDSRICYDVNEIDNENNEGVEENNENENDEEKKENENKSEKDEKEKIEGFETIKENKKSEEYYKVQESINVEQKEDKYNKNNKNIQKNENPNINAENKKSEGNENNNNKEEGNNNHSEGDSVFFVENI